MRKLAMGLKVGLLVVGLLAMVVTPAMAQFGDPLTLAASGVLLPFFANTANGDLSVLETYSPVGNNKNVNSGMHLVFFNQNCTRVVSVNRPLTTNDVDLYFIPNVQVPSMNGLIAIGNAALNGLDLIPLQNPIHSRVLWVNGITSRTRVLEPITLDTVSTVNTPNGNYVGTTPPYVPNLSFFTFGPPNFLWNPLRTGITFFAPRVGGGLNTSIIFICPKTTIQHPTQVNPPGLSTQAFPFTFFPTMSDSTGQVVQNTQVGFAASYPIGALRGQIFDLDEHPLVDVTAACDCVSEQKVETINGQYTLLDTYTELAAAPNFITGLGTDGKGTGDFAFTGYRTINITGTFIDLFGRLSNGSRKDIAGGGDVPTTNNR